MKYIKQKKELVAWFGFSVFVAIIPILFGYLQSASIIGVKGKIPFDLAETLASGELLLISIALTGEMIGDIITKDVDISAKVLTGIGCTISIVVSSFEFGIVATTQPESRQKTPIIIISCILFGLTLIAGSFYKWWVK